MAKLSLADLDAEIANDLAEFGTASDSKTSSASSLKSNPAFPLADKYDDLYVSAGAEYGIDPLLIKALVQQESAGDASATGQTTRSGAKAKGLVQLMPATAKAYGVTDVNDPKQTIPVAAKILAENLARTDGNITDAVTMYHGGPNRKIWGEQTAAYAPAVMEKYDALGGNFDLYNLDKNIAGDLAEFVPKVAAAPKVLQENSAKEPLRLPADRIEVTPEGAGLSPKVLSAGSSPSFADMPAPINTALSGGNGQSVTMSLVPENPPVETQGTKVSLPINTEPDELWGPWSQASDAFLLGQGTKVAAGVGALMGHPYAEAKNKVDAIKTAWEDKNPTKGLAIDLTASTISTLAAMSLGQEYAAAPLATKLSSAFPKAAPAIAKTGEFLSGNFGKAKAGGGALLTGAEETGKGVVNYLTKRLPSMLASGGIQGAEAGLLQSGMHPDAPAIDQAGMGALVGAGTNAITNTVLGPLGSVVAPRVAALAQQAEKLGIPTKISDIPGASPVYKLINKFWGSPIDPADQAGSITKAFSKTFGEDAAEIDQALLTKADTRIGKMFDKAEEGLVIKAGDAQLHRDLADAELYLHRNVTDPQAIVQGERALEIIRNDLLTGDMNGKAFRSITKHGTLLDIMANSRNPGVDQIGMQLRDALTDAAERSSTPEAVKILGDARAQYKNYLIARKLADETTGHIDPTKILGAVKKFYPRYSKSGAGEAGTIAEIGKNLLERAPSAERGANPLTQKLMEAGGATGAAVGAYHGANYLLANPTLAAGVLGGAGLVHGVGKVASSLVESPRWKASMLEKAVAGTPNFGLNPLVPSAVQLYAPEK